MISITNNARPVLATDWAVECCRYKSVSEGNHSPRDGLWLQIAISKCILFQQSLNRSRMPTITINIRVITHKYSSTSVILKVHSCTSQTNKRSSCSPRSHKSRNCFVGEGEEQLVLSRSYCFNLSQDLKALVNVFMVPSLAAMAITIKLVTLH